MTLLNMPTETPSNNSSFNYASPVGMAADVHSNDSSHIVSVVLMVVLIFVTFQGNLWILVAILSNPTLRDSSTNVFVISLMMVGLLASCLALPLSVTIFMMEPSTDRPDLCNVSGFFNACFMMCSMLTLSLISIDRFYCIALPMHHAAHATTKLYALIALSVWSVAAGVSSMPLVDSNGSSYGYLAPRAYCIYDGKQLDFARMFAITVTVVSFLLPSTVLITMYTGVFLMARKAAHTIMPRPSSTSHRPGQSGTTSQQSVDRNNAAADTSATTMSRVVGAVLITQPPQQTRRPRESVPSSILASASGGDVVVIGDHRDIGDAKTAAKISRRHAATNSAPGYPSAKISPMKSRLDQRSQPPKPIDPLIFSVSSSSTTPQDKPTPVIVLKKDPIFISHNAPQRPTLNARTKQLPPSPTTAIPADDGTNGNAQRSKPGSSSCSDGAPKPVASKQRNCIEFVCGCQLKPEAYGRHVPVQNRSSKVNSNYTAPSTSISTTNTNASATETMPTYEAKVGAKHKNPRVISAQTPPFIGPISFTRHRPSYSKALRTVMIIVASYFLFWSLHFICLVYWLVHQTHLSEALNILAVWLGFASYGVNPCLYGCMNRQIREELAVYFRSLAWKLKCCCCCGCWAFYRHCITPDQSHADGTCSCCVPPKRGDEESDLDNMDVMEGENFFQFLQRTQDDNTPVPLSLVE